MTKWSALPTAADPDGSEIVAVLQGGANKRTTVQKIVDMVLALVRAGVSATYDTLKELADAHVNHVTEVDPYVHTAAKVSYSGTVGTPDVASALDQLDSDKADASALPTEFTRMLSSSATTVNKNTTLVEETLLTFNVPVNFMDTDGDLLVLESSGDILANNGSPTFTWKFKSSTVVIDTPADALALSASLRRFKLRVAIRRLGANSQAISFDLSISLPGANVAMPSDKHYVGQFTDISVVNWGAITALTFTVQMSTSNANDRVRLYGYDAYKIPA